MFKILMVDDSKTVHAFVRNLKLPAHFNIKSVYNGQEAIEHISSTQEKYDLVLLDWEMPILNGPETLKQLSDVNFKTPIIMMTTKNNPEDIAYALNLGASEYIMKPFDAEILLEKIKCVANWELKNVS